MRNKLTTILTIAIPLTPATAFAVGPNQMEIRYSVTNKSTEMSGLYGSNHTKDNKTARLYDLRIR